MAPEGTAKKSSWKYGSRSLTTTAGRSHSGRTAISTSGWGDGGSARDPQGNGQNLETVLGSLLRIDVSSGGPGYSVPGDNPFLGQGNARGEIWAFGPAQSLALLV